MSSPTRTLERTVSALSIQSSSSEQDLDWDRSMTSETSDDSRIPSATTPRNSVIFPAEGDTPGRSTSLDPPAAQGGPSGGRSERTLSELLKLHAEKGTRCEFTQEEANRVGDVLGQWINSSSSPYEGDDDFFVRGKDDLFIPSKRAEALVEGRQRGMSESGGLVSSRPPSSADFFNPQQS
ncbi:hypothetical protein CC1G_11619 [Coprinopsis cinerea okayama7|uniref:Uncharacterized protein n=1 Tax=Coprinopsis cinerea (strain Okayama-7 / 130 / ATCC MYA-4618 / FGSC 9003) TaxID=240176 RepID=A8PCS8_COPC7|nr:hypothetical protein CC1G_11619 [Coprinopsis cinerea okayama7\|eukprot:XP_001840462.1 hypothetical protein CC1G_11619 [Coprinopsis cinerea okayama7\